MKLLFVLFATWAIVSSASADNQQIMQSRQTNEGPHSKLLTGSKEMIEFTKSDGKYDGNSHLLEYQRKKDVGTVKQSTPKEMEQIVNNYESTETTSSNTKNINQPQNQLVLPQDQHEPTIPNLQQAISQINKQQRLSKSLERNTEILKAQKQLQIAISQVMGLNILEQFSIINQDLKVDQANDHLKSRRKINMKSIQNHYQARGNRMRTIIRVEPDTQDNDNILKIYQDLKDKKQRFIRSKRQLLQHDKLQQIDQISANKQIDVLFYTLLALLSVVAALPLIRLLFCCTKAHLPKRASSSQSQIQKQCELTEILQKPSL